MKVEVATVVLNFNNPEDSIACLESLERQSDLLVQCVLVDNGSTDDSVTKISGIFPNVEIIEIAENLGYAEGNNVGIRYVLEKGYKYIFVLNNDTIVSPDCLGLLLAGIKKSNNVAAVAPISYYFNKPDVIYFAGGKITREGFTKHIGVGKKDIEITDQSSDTEWISGCAILFDSDALINTGLFETKYYLLFEDADWSLRARKLGFRLRLIPKAKIWHKVSSSFGGTWSISYIYYYTRNNLLWIERNFNLKRRPYLYFHAVKRSLKFIKPKSEMDRNKLELIQMKTVIHGIVDYIFRRFGKRNINMER